MASRKIFIGSSSESMEVAKNVAQNLSDSGYTPLRWWKEFPPGSITIDRLLEISNSVDGAIFVLQGDDKGWYRGEGTVFPRDNVILEYGLFLSRLGREKTLILKDDAAKIPSDINSVSYERISVDLETVAERAVKHFTRQFEDGLPPILDAIRQIDDPFVINRQMRKSRTDVRNKDLYVGLEGAKRWLNVVEENSYWPSGQQQNLRRMVMKSINETDCRTYVSFGPGDAKLDKEIAIKIRRKEPQVEFIPVDISDGLLKLAVSDLSNQVKVPVGILGDFEDRLNFIQTQLRRYANPPVLFSLLGNTFANMDNYEETFLLDMHMYMQKDSDQLLMDVSLAQKDWSMPDDVRGHYKSYSESYRKFLAEGVTQFTGESSSSFVKDFETRVEFVSGESDVPNTKTIVLKDKVTHRTIFSFRRYDYDELKKWLEKIGFNIVFKENQFDPSSKIGDAVFLLKKA